MTSLAIVNAHLLDPASQFDGHGGILIVDGHIAAVGPSVIADELHSTIETVDVGGKYVCPGLIDGQVFVGEPGEDHRETIKTAARSAAKGGVTTLVTQPNTLTPIDSAAMVKLLKDRAEDAGIRIAPMACITKASKGGNLVNFGMLKEAGAVAYTDTPLGVGNSRLMRQVLLYAKTFDCLVVQHIEDTDLVGNGVMHEGTMANNLGLPGIPPEAETIIFARDILLVNGTGARYHAAALSSKLSLDHLISAKQKNMNITAGVQIAHLLLTDSDVGSYYTFRKLSPPLRGEADREALQSGVRDGYIDIIVSGHNPQPPDTKRQPFIDAAAGSVGVETLLPALIMVHKKTQIPLLRLIECVTSAPANLFGLSSGRLNVGSPADITVFDTETQWELRRKNLSSLSYNTCFDKQVFTGKVHQTYMGGKLIFDTDEKVADISGSFRQN